LPRQDLMADILDMGVRLSPPRAKAARVRYWNLLGRGLVLLLIALPIILWSIVKHFLKTPKSLQGQVALVTGAGRGLGQGLAMAFAEQGCRVACVDIDDVSNQETVKKINEKFPDSARGYKTNVAKVEEIETLKESVEKDFGPVDLLINNAGLIVGQAILDEQVSTIEATISVNLKSHFWTIRQFLPTMLKRNKGHIVAIASASSLQAISKAPTYSSTKWGLYGLMESLSLELDEIPGNQVKTTCACPYFVNTSEDYTKKWDITLPELSVRTTVKEIVNQVRKDTRVFTVPSHMFWLFHIFKLLPDDFTKIARQIFSVEIKKCEENKATLQIIRNTID